MISNIYFI